MNLMKLFRSFGYGFSGLFHVLKSEQSMRIHLLAAVVVVTTGFFFRIAAGEWMAVAICIGLVVSMECLNTAIERLADRVSTDQHPLIQQAKDSAAAAVLVISISSATIGGIVFLPKIWTWFWPVG